MVHLFIHLLLSANHEDGRWQGVEVKRGQLITGRKALSEATGISEKAIRTTLNKLALTREIRRETASKFSIITICKYNEYQSINDVEGPAKGQQRASKGPAKGHKQEEEEGREERIDIVESEPRQRENIPYADIVSFLNAKAGTAFKPGTQSTKSHIRARWAEGFRLADFHAVIEHKTDEWKTDAKMCEFLRPVTLFGTKFESYLQAAKAGAGQQHLYGIHGKWKDK